MISNTNPAPASEGGCYDIIGNQLPLSLNLTTAGESQDITVNWSVPSNGKRKSVDGLGGACSQPHALGTSLYICTLRTALMLASLFADSLKQDNPGLIPSLDQHFYR